MLLSVRIVRHSNTVAVMVCWAPTVACNVLSSTDQIDEDKMK